jgi:hypothetical protein
MRGCLRNLTESNLPLTGQTWFLQPNGHISHLNPSQLRMSYVLLVPHAVSESRREETQSFVNDIIRTWYLWIQNPNLQHVACAPNDIIHE